MSLAALRHVMIELLTRWLNHEHPRASVPLCDFSRLCYEIRPGDILLVDGRSRVSEVIKTITQSRWSHAMLYIGRLHDLEDADLIAWVRQHGFEDPSTHLLVESLLGKGTILTDLEFYRYEHLRICRPKGLSREDRHTVIAYALGQLGIPYDVRHIVDLARYFFPWTIVPRRWRSTLFEQNPGGVTKIICSTLLAKAFTSVQYPVLPEIADENGSPTLSHGNAKLITPSDFDYSPYFEIIKVPPFELESTPKYRHLPWKKENARVADHTPSINSVAKGEGQKETFFDFLRRQRKKNEKDEDHKHFYDDATD